MADRAITALHDATQMREGMGARVRRVLPTQALHAADPFVLLDEFFVEAGAGFPDHPHRGFEIITYMLEGALRHTDSLGNDRAVGAGGLQRITAGRGITHSEMPAAEGTNHGLQLWINLPQRLKGLEPGYQEVLPGEIPEIRSDRARVRLLVDERSPTELHTPTLYLHVRLEKGAEWAWGVPVEYEGFAYVLEGIARFGADDTEGTEGQVLVLGEGVRLPVVSVQGVEFALIAGRPHSEQARIRGSFVE